MVLLRTPLFDWHCHNGGRMVEFGGWEMPVQYTGIVDEHHAVRKSGGLFDISHMGRLSFRGSDAVTFLDQLLTCRVDNLVDGQVRYGLICNASGGILDDVLVNRLDQKSYGLVVNASNREKIVNVIAEQMESFKAEAGHRDVVIQDQTRETAMIALQGPLALSMINRFTNNDFESMRYYSGREIQLSNMTAFVSRTGYTGEDGFEFIIPAEKATQVWESLIAMGVPLGWKPCGLGCRDTLRLEAAMPLYGHELSDGIDPLTAGLGFAVKLEKTKFIGRDALIAIKNQHLTKNRVGLRLDSRRIAREHSEIYSGATRIGEVTSGTFSPTLEQSIAMAYVLAANASIGTKVDVDIRGKRESAEIVSLPFYKR